MSILCVFSEFLNKFNSALFPKCIECNVRPLPLNTIMVKPDNSCLSLFFHALKETVISQHCNVVPLIQSLQSGSDRISSAKGISLDVGLLRWHTLVTTEETVTQESWNIRSQMLILVDVIAIQPYVMTHIYTKNVCLVAWIPHGPSVRLEWLTSC